MTKREKTAVLLAAVLTIGITGYSAWQLLVQGVLSWHITQPETGWMFGELIFVWLLCFLLLYGKFGRLVKLTAIAVAAILFCWLHVVFLPVLLAGLYVVYLILAGRWISTMLLRQRLTVVREFALGSACVIVIFCMLSLVRLGSIRNLRCFVVVSGTVLLVSWLFQLAVDKKGKSGIAGKSGTAGKSDIAGKSSTTCQDMVKPVFTCQKAAMLAAIFVLLLLQAGRMNLAVDFDSIWYGVRSHVMLNSGTGIYENPGTLGVVYTYSKGWEVLTLPLAGLPSYSFLIAFNLWVAVLMLLAAYDTAASWLSPESALWVPFILAAIPGVMNMAVTAKADLLTLFYQVLMVQGVLCFLKERQVDELILGLAAGGVSLTLKPTALVFSSAVVGIAILWLLWDRYNWGREKTGQAWWVFLNRRIWWVFAIAAACLAGIWGRTVKLVGVPVTSVFYQIFQKLGFQVKYPFYASGFPAAGSHLTIGESVQFLLTRIIGVLFNPQGDDMAHVIIAWGTVLPTAFLLLWGCLALISIGQKQARGKDVAGANYFYAIKQAARQGKKYGIRQVRCFLSLLTVAILLIDLVSLYSLSQIDGNYYILFYFLIVLTGCIWLEQYGVTIAKAGKKVLLVPWLFAVVICGITNWAWSLGFTPIQVINKGFYNHPQMAREKRAEQGSQAIWEILAANPQNRVIALGEHPGVLTFPCQVQSYVDVSGYWGNPEVVSDAPHFMEYLAYAKIDYLYMEKEYVDTSVRIYQIIRTLIAEGYLEDVREENGNLILSVRKTEPAEGDIKAAEQNLKVFDIGYIQHP